MHESSGRDRYTEMMQQPYDPDIIRAAPDLEPGDEDPSVVEIQNFLKRFGYLDAAVAQGSTPEPGRLDEVTVDALTAYQRFYKPALAELSKVGTPGSLDAATRELMATPQTCGMPDVLPGEMPPGPLARYNLHCAWDRRFFTYAFQPLPSGRMTKDLGYLPATMALRRAFQTWAAAGVGILLNKVYIDESPDFIVEWRSADDPDLPGGLGPMFLGHSDFPAGCSVYADAPPRPCHFNDEHFTWNIVGDLSGSHADVETVALHQIGHLLGLGDSGDTESVMFPDPSAYGPRHTLGADDIEGLRALYPPSLNRISAVHSVKALNVLRSSQDNGAPIVQWFWTGGNHQRFRVEHVGEPSGYRFVAQHSGKVLTVEDASTASGARIIQWDWQAGANQKFRVQAIGAPGNGYRIVALHSGKALSVFESSTASGAQIIQSDWFGGQNQLWRFR